MNQIRDQLDDAIGVPPPSTINVDGLMTRQRKLVRARRWGAGGGVAAALLGIGVAGALVLGGPGQVPPAGSALASGYNKATAEHLEKALRKGLTAALPDTEFTPGRWGDQKNPFGFVADGDYLYEAHMDTKDAKGEGAIAAFANPVKAPFRPATSCDQVAAGETRFYCEERTGADGEKIVTVTEGSGDSGLVFRRVMVTKRDGTYLELRSENISSRSAASQEKGALKASRDEAPITDEQLLRVALARDFTLAIPANLAGPGVPGEPKQSPDFDKATAERLGKALRTSVEKELPDTELAPASNGTSGKLFEFRSEDHDAYQSGFDTRDSHGAGNVMVVVGPAETAGAATRCDERADQDGLAEHRTSCRVEIGDNGERIVIVTSDNRNEQPDEAKRIRSHVVFVTKQDGTAVKIYARNLDTAGPDERPKGHIYQPTSTEVPIATEQMVRIAVNSDLTLKS